MTKNKVAVFITRCITQCLQLYITPHFWVFCHSRMKIATVSPASFSALREPKWTKCGKDMGRSLQVCFRFYINCWNSKRPRHKSKGSKIPSKLCTLWPLYSSGEGLVKWIYLVQSRSITLFDIVLYGGVQQARRLGVLR